MTDTHYIQPRISKSVTDDDDTGIAIRYMKNGTTGYTVPWAYNHESGLLNIAYHVYKMPHGNCTMKIKRDNKGIIEIFL